MGLQKQSVKCKICKKHVHQKCVQYMPDCGGVSVCVRVRACVRICVCASACACCVYVCVCVVCAHLSVSVSTSCVYTIAIYSH